jgi:hypothetical protein
VGGNPCVVVRLLMSGIGFKMPSERHRETVCRKRSPNPLKRARESPKFTNERNGKIIDAQSPRTCMETRREQVIMVQRSEAKSKPGLKD